MLIKMDIDRKSRRKTISEVNDYTITEIVDTKIAALESNPKIPKLLHPNSSQLSSDHTYSKPKRLAPHSPIKLSVEVKVEEFDELSISHDENLGSNMEPTQTKPQIRSFSINIEKMYKISDHIVWSSINPADKYLGIQLKNVWGCMLQRNLKQDPYDALIQEALQQWGLVALKGKIWRLNPLFYQCYICNIAWWHLNPFRQHIKNHQINELCISHIDQSLESFIVVDTSVVKHAKYIQLDGQCHQCGNNFPFHLTKILKDYTCPDCNEVFKTCSLYAKHYGVCKAYTPSKNMVQCDICCKKVSNIELQHHLCIMHSVRSDIPIPLLFKNCLTCNSSYVLTMHFAHSCTKYLLASSCNYCFRKFPNKTLAKFHITRAASNIQCKICNKLLEKDCMELEHMVGHSKKFGIYYKCVISDCPLTTVFADEKSMRLHGTVAHKMKYDRRRATYLKVIVPIQCVTKKQYEFEVFSSRGIESNNKIYSYSQSDEDADKEIALEETVMQNEMLGITPEDNENQDDSAYEQMLSAVFKITPNQTDDGAITIKTEPKEIEETDDVIETEMSYDIEIGNRIKTEPISIETEMSVMEFLAKPEIKLERQDVSDDSNDYVTGVQIDAEQVTAELVADMNIKIMDTYSESANQKDSRDTDAIKDFMNAIVKSEDDKYNAGRGKKKTKRKYVKKTSTRKVGKLYICSRCGYTDVHRKYKAHVESNCEAAPKSPKPIYSCTKCNTDFNNLKYYLLHLVDHGIEPLSCLWCLQKCDMKELICHFHKHLAKNFINYWVLNKECDQPNKRKMCKICKAAVQQNEFFKHWENHFMIDSIESPQNESGTSNRENATPVRYNLNSNVEKKARGVKPDDSVEMTSDNDPESLMIRKFEKKMLQPDVLHTALEILQTPNREKMCFICERMFERRADCKRHLVEHLHVDALVKKNFSEDKLFKCQICSENFTCNESYKFHMRGHGSLPVYKCNLCSKTFSDSSNFAKHKKVHGLRVHMCDYCKRKFHSKKTLEVHIIFHLNNKPLTCKICRRQFFYESALKKHAKNHSKVVTRFPCQLCEISFVRLKDKWDHMWLVHGERKYMADCPVCGKKFRKYTDVKSHASVEHGVILNRNKIKDSIEKYANRNDSHMETIVIKEEPE